MKIGRNDQCPCGSGKKYKKCCSLKLVCNTNTTFKTKYEFKTGSYGDVGDFKPSIACHKLIAIGEWEYHFVLVKISKSYDDDAQANQEAEADMSVAYEIKNAGGSDAEFANKLKQMGYVKVDDFNIVK